MARANLTLYGYYSQAHAHYKLTQTGLKIGGMIYLTPDGKKVVVTAIRKVKEGDDPMGPVFPRYQWEDRIVVGPVKALVRMAFIDDIPQTDELRSLKESYDRFQANSLRLKGT